MPAYKTGDLVHIPQAVTLVGCDSDDEADPQLTIPLSIHETVRPEIGVIVEPSNHGYVRVFCSGRHWSVKDKSVYFLGGAGHD
tara:strand:+ start:92 stop:340 length:249 start_codon:yes stop_codon:yes gene_type:complete